MAHYGRIIIVTRRRSEWEPSRRVSAPTPTVRRFQYDFSLQRYAKAAEFSKPRGNGSFGVHAAVRTAAHLPLAEAADYPESLKEPFGPYARLDTCSLYLLDSHRARCASCISSGFRDHD